ncbi:MAG: hypothetical protein EXR72_18160 [Myxococcales bacterium]|nr:hypothetical protein [Myxococcales bacterium]
MRGLLPSLAATCALLAGCSKGPEEPPRAILSVELRDRVEIGLTPVGADGIAIDLELHFVKNGHGLLDPEKPLRARGRIELFPEAATEMYTARFSGAAVPAGLCGDQPVSLALSLVRRDGHARVAGALTAYCGADRYAGVPVRLLRLSGDLPRPR